MTMASKPSTDASRCQTYSESYPQSSRSERTQSWSQFEPGNWMTANRGLRRPASLGRDNSSCVGGSATLTSGLIGDFEAETPGHGVGEEIPAKLLELGLDGGAVDRGRIELDFHEFTRPNGTGAGESELVERIADSHPLGIQRDGLWHEGDTCLDWPQ